MSGDFQPMTANRTVTHLEGTDFQKSRAFSPAVVGLNQRSATRRSIHQNPARDVSGWKISMQRVDHSVKLCSSRNSDRNPGRRGGVTGRAVHGKLSVFRTGRAPVDLKMPRRARAIARQLFKSSLVLTLWSRSYPRIIFYCRFRSRALLGSVCWQIGDWTH